MLGRSRDFSRRSRPLRVAGPPGLKEHVARQWRFGLVEQRAVRRLTLFASSSTAELSPTQATRSGRSFSLLDEVLELISEPAERAWGQLPRAQELVGAMERVFNLFRIGWKVQIEESGCGDGIRV